MPKLSVSPLQDPRVAVEALGETHPAIPQLAKGTVLLPMVNDGEVELRGGQATLKAGSEKRHLNLERLAPGEVGVLVFGRWDVMPSYELVLHCNGPDGRSFRTSARFNAELDRYV